MKLLYFWSSALGAAGYCFLLVPLGFAVGHGTRLGDFRKRAFSTQLLWSVALATPPGILLSVFLERFLSVAQVAWLWALAALGGWLFLLAKRNRQELPADQRKLVHWGVAAALCMGLYVLCAGLPIEVGNRLYESQSMADVAVRVPIVDMATQHGMPPINPFDAVDHAEPRMRYYYYWYMLCGVVGHLLHLTGRATLTASGVWAILLLLSVGFLLFSTLFRPQAAPWGIRKLCLLALPVGCITGLDIVPVLGALFLHPPILYPDPDYWRGISDFSPSFNLAMLYAPHHVAGLAISFLCFLLVLPPHETGLLSSPVNETTLHRWMRALLAGSCLGMLIGCSSFMGLFAGLAGAFFLVQRMLKRDWRNTGVVLIAAVFALLLSLPFFYEVTHVQAHALGSDQHAHLFRFSLHSLEMARELLRMAQAHTGYKPGHVGAVLEKAFLWVLLGIVELGFFGCVLFVRTREDWRARRSLAPRKVYQWMLFFGIFLPGFWFSSATIAGSNDLSRHAGIALRLLAVLWATPLVARFLHNRDIRRATLSRWPGRTAVAFAILGLLTQGYQVVAQRFYSVYSERFQSVVDGGPFSTVADFSLYTYDIFYANETLRLRSAPPGNLLYDPLLHISGIGSPFNLYQSRRAVAGEPYCMTAFGGDFAACRAALPAIEGIYGGSTNQIDIGLPEHVDPALQSLGAMAALCRRHGLGAVLVTNQAGAWTNPGSFVWQAQTLYASPRVRMLACPQTSVTR